MTKEQLFQNWDCLLLKMKRARSCRKHKMEATNDELWAMLVGLDILRHLPDEYFTGLTKVEGDTVMKECDWLDKEYDKVYEQYKNCCPCGIKDADRETMEHLQAIKDLLEEAYKKND